MNDEKAFRPTYVIGELLWAKIGNHSFWPCMVSYDPYKGSFFKKVKVGKTEAEVEIYHVQYFGKEVQRGWTQPNLIMTFHGKDKYFAEMQYALDNASSDNVRTKLEAKYRILPKEKEDWSFAVKEAENALHIRLPDRYELFVFKYEFKLKKQINGTPIKKKRKKSVLVKKNSAKTKSEKILTEPTSIVEPLCFYCEKGNVDLNCHGPCAQYYHKHCLGIIKAPDNFKCAHCLFSSPTCLVCKNNHETKKCIKCNTYFHDYCLERFPCANVKKSTCSYHMCLSCHLRNPHNVAANSKGPFVKCFRCPTSFHVNIDCIPVGSIKLSPDVIVCPQHFQGKHRISDQPTVNFNFCSVCFEGGSLTLCDSCPQAFHMQCVGLDENPKSDWFCDDCIAGKFLFVGMIVWVKTGAYRWWPAKIMDYEDLPGNIQAIRTYDGEFPVYFFGTNEYYWTHSGRVYPYNDENCNLKKSGPCLSNERSLESSFKKALEEAEIAFKEYLQKRQAPGSKPAPFKHIRVNRAIPPIVIKCEPQSSCICDPSKPHPCGSNTCLNRSMNLECHPNTCKAGEKCENQRFQRRQYASVKVMKTENRGWGLQALQFIHKGSFVMEYVGEVITYQEYQKRVTNMKLSNCQNYYFLYLTRDRLIDAGPSGNLARFINHSCQPNCVMEKWSVNGDMKIGIFALSDIQPGDELTFNYQADANYVQFNQHCMCNAENCQGYIGKNGKNGEKSIIKNGKNGEKSIIKNGKKKRKLA